MNAALNAFSIARFRLVVVLLLLAMVFMLAQQSDVISSLDPYVVRELVNQWGPLSALVFIGLYAIGLLLYVPGTLFTVAGALLFGQLYGVVIVWVAANVAMNLSFVMVRLIGGQPFDQTQHPLLRRMVDRLDDRPILTIIILRMFLYTAPGLNTVLALCRVRLRDHIWATLLGSFLPTLVVVVMTDMILSYFYA